jgi:TonB family protein
MSRWIAALIVIVSAAAPSPAVARTMMPKSFSDLSYPADALAARVSGAVVVKVTTDPTGRVVEAEALSGPAALRPDAVANARQWTLAPGEPTDAIVYRFEIDDGLCNADRQSLFRLARPDLAVITACTGLGRARQEPPHDEVPVEDYGARQPRGWRR